MAHNFRIEIPTTIQLHIRQAEVVPYLELSPVPLNPGRNWTFSNPEDSAAVAVSEWSKKRGIPAYQMYMPGWCWRDVIKKDREAFLSDPKMSAAIFFIAGKNWNRISGHPNGTEMFIIDDVIYRRITWRSIGQGEKGGGMCIRSRAPAPSDRGVTADGARLRPRRWRRNGPPPKGACDPSLPAIGQAGNLVRERIWWFSYFLLKCKSSNKNPVKDQILNGLGNGIFMEPT